MKVVGLITEYNPFHNGHLYHMEQARKLTGADYVVVVMSGNFLQRGEPAIIDKFHRSEMALSCGADLVLELPAYYACASAEYFALGGVSLLNSLGIVDALCFGSELGDLHVLEQIASVLLEEPDKYQQSLKSFLKEGLAYPSARSRALCDYFKALSLPHMVNPLNNPLSKAQALEHNGLNLEVILNSPNNILAIEYLKALKKLNSPMKPIVVERIANNYHDLELHESISSATAIRTQIFQQEAVTTGGSEVHFPSSLESISPQVPDTVFQQLCQEHHSSFPICSNDFSGLLHYQLLSAMDSTQFSKCFDVSEDLAHRIWNSRLSYQDLERFVLVIKTRQYTQTRIRRALLHILLNLKSDTVRNAALNSFPVPYCRILGFRKASVPLLSELKRQCPLPIITKLANISALLSDVDKPDARNMLDFDIYCSHVYHGVITDKFHDGGYNEFTRPIVIL